MSTPTIDPITGRRLKPEQGWRKFRAEVEAAAAAHKPKPKRTITEAQRAALRPGRLWEHVHRAPQCRATTRAGERCKQWCVRGAERCRMHGGMLEAPTHPANIDLQHDRPARLEARKSFNAHSYTTRTAVHHAYRAADTKGATRRRRRWQDLNQGAQALEADDNGKAFRLWMQQLND